MSDNIKKDVSQPGYILLNELVKRNWEKLHKSNNSEQKILEGFVKGGNRGIYELYQSTELAYSSVHETIKKMEKAGYVKLVEEGRGKKNTPKMIYKLTEKGVWRAIALIGEDINLDFLIAKYRDTWDSVKYLKKGELLYEVIFWLRSYFLAEEPENIGFYFKIQPYGTYFVPITLIE